MDIHTLENVDFKFEPKFRKWLFKSGNFSLIQKCNGRQNAFTVARIVNGAMKRGGWDGMARSQVSRMGL